MSKETKVYYGVRPPGPGKKRVERISEEAANEGYMTALEAAQVRARAIGGVVVTRKVTTKTTPWEELHE